MDVLIIEDEPLAAEHLCALIAECDAEINIVEILDSVNSTERWLKANKQPPLIFMDIHLGDGDCFEIFNRVTITSFIIFTTAYDQYALKAFQVNSVDYLLKPINKESVSNALKKYKAFASAEEAQKVQPDISTLLDVLQNKKPDYKERFVVKVGAHIRMVKTNEIACFYSLEKATYLVTKKGKQYVVDFALDKLLALLDPDRFFRVSRQYIVELESISDVVHLGPSRVKIKLISDHEDVVVSRDKIKPFKQWLEG